MGYKTEKQAVTQAIKIAKKVKHDRFIVYVRDGLYDDPNNLYQVTDLLGLQTFFAGDRCTATITPDGAVHW